MSKLVTLVSSLGFFLICAPAMAQGTTAAVPGMALVGAGLAVLGVGVGIGRIGGSACESMARQPEMAAKVQQTMIISAALIEGVAFFALLLVIFVK
jgi:F-type H+-transporting ATPase subunit c